MSEQGVDVEPFWKRRWRLEPTWTARELAQLCCGWDPETGWHPHCQWDDDLPETDATIARQALYESAWNAIQRALRLGDLRPAGLPGEPSAEAFYYGDAPVLRSDDATRWAAARFPDFALPPETLGRVTAGSLGGTTEPHTQITVDQAESVEVAPHSWQSETADESSRRVGRRAEVDAFIAQVHQAQGRRIKRTDIWRVAGYGEATEFERFQRGLGTEGATAKFRKVLRMAPADFVKRLEALRDSAPRNADP